MKPEAMVQQRVVAILRAAGCIVYNLSQGYRPGGKRHGTTRQSKGLADLWVFVPRRQLGFWFETKAPDDWADLELPAADRERIYRKKQTTEQAAFEGYCRLSNVPYVLGGAAEAEAWLVAAGVNTGSTRRLLEQDAPKVAGG